MGIAFHVPCRALRRDGKPCRLGAAHGDTYCPKHGGITQQATSRAELRQMRREGQAAFAAEYEAHRAALAAWQAERAQVVAELLGMDAADVTDLDIAFCRAEHGRPDNTDTMPTWPPANV